MKATRVFAVTGIFLLTAGCGSTQQTRQTGANRTRPEVMDLNDSPPRRIPPTQRVDPFPPEPIAAEVPAAPAPRKHVVAAKDTLYVIAKTYYGDSKRWPEIVKANPGLVPERMPVGKTIIIP